MGCRGGVGWDVGEERVITCPCVQISLASSQLV